MKNNVNVKKLQEVLKTKDVRSQLNSLLPQPFQIFSVKTYCYDKGPFITVWIEDATFPGELVNVSFYEKDITETFDYKTEIIKKAMEQIPRVIEYNKILVAEKAVISMGPEAVHLKELLKDYIETAEKSIKVHNEMGMHSIALNHKKYLEKFQKCLKIMEG